MSTSYQIPPHVLKAFLEPCLAVFGQPSSDDPERFLSEYGRHLKNFGSAELTAASDHLMRHHKGPARWPKLSECLEACEDARERINLTKPAQDKPSLSHKELCARAESLMRCDMGYRAAREGWANGLRDHVLKNGRMPNEYTAENIRQTSEFVARCSTGRENLGIMHDGLVTLAGQFVERAAQIGERLETGELP